MGLLSKFENKVEDGIEGAAGALGRSSLSPVQITKKAEKQMRREKIVGAGKQYAPTLYTVLVSPEDDAKLFKYYPTLAGETETYLLAKAREIGYVMDGQPLVRFLADPQLKKGKFEVVAEMVASSIVDQLRDDEMQRYGLPTSAGRRRAVAPAQRERNLQPNMQPLPNMVEPGQIDPSAGWSPVAPSDVPYDPAFAQAQAAQGVPYQQVQPMQGQPAQGGQVGQAPQAAQVQPQAQAYDAYQQPVQRQPMSAADMNVPSILGSQVNEVPQDSHAPRGTQGASGRPSVRSRGYVAPEQLIEDVALVQQVGAETDDVAGVGASPVVVMPALSQDVGDRAGAQPVSGVDAVFGEGTPTIETGGRNRGASPVATQRVFLYDEARDRAYSLTGDRQNIGRESANEIVVPDINISRVHAEIHMQPDGQWVISDLGSTNGLYVNGQKVQTAHLKDADMITLGTSTLEFQLLS